MNVVSGRSNRAKANRTKKTHGAKCVCRHTDTHRKYSEKYEMKSLFNNKKQTST